MLSMWDSVGYAMLGGVASQVVVFAGRIVEWQKKREKERADGGSPSPLSSFIDPSADILVAAVMIALAALAGALLHSEITGAVPAVVAGAAAWDILVQIVGRNTAIAKALVRDVSQSTISELERRS